MQKNTTPPKSDKTGDPPGGWQYIERRLRDIERTLQRGPQPANRLMDVLAYYERALSMIGEDRPECRCGFCAGCLARNALAGPEPGATWFEWERAKELNRESMRARANSRYIEAPAAVLDRIRETVRPDALQATA